jgi:hypothetical protein
LFFSALEEFLNEVHSSLVILKKVLDVVASPQNFKFSNFIEIDRTDLWRLVSSWPSFLHLLVRGEAIHPG